MYSNSNGNNLGNSVAKVILSERFFRNYRTFWPCEICKSIRTGIPVLYEYFHSCHFFVFFLILYELIGPPLFWDLWSIWLSRHGHAFTLSIFQFTEKDWQLNLGHQTAYGRCCIILVCRRNKLFPQSLSLSLSLSLSNPGWWYARRDPAEAKLIVFRHFQEWKPNTQHPTLNTQHPTPNTDCVAEGR